ncbi:MEMO1 family protein [Methanohalophilus profundi]|uniref:MEMO1 family protein n=1 Tax=Methanohalophilus profundi TaxID=2138083 RepID=UPI00101D34E0|nr:MEMO1 family protein [Methanohalophilus profundi]
MIMRQPTVAGQFYPLGIKPLKKELSHCFRDLELVSEDVYGIVVPHAGYMFSGPVAAYAYSKLPKADTYVIFGPNHTGYGSAVALSTQTWSTPLGDVEADEKMGEMLAGSIIDMDEVAHMYEHSIEVQLPFLQYRFGDSFKILPICMGLQDIDTAREVGLEVAKAAEKSGKKVVFIASSDFTHYQPHETAKETDMYLIDSLLNMDVEEFNRRREERFATACGYGPIVAMYTAAEYMGANTAELLKYATSGDMTGDYSAVVGYAAIIVK